MNELQKMALMILAGLAVPFMPVTAGPAWADAKAGESGFREHCAACHADGGNIIRPEKTLSRADREKNGVTSAADIVRLMRLPGAGMSQFDQETLSDQEAHAIAEYILETFR
jgi:cytochrome c6